MILRRSISRALAIALGVVASAATIPAQAAHAATPPAELHVDAPGVTVLKKGASAFTAAKNNQALNPGDTVQTDTTGLAELSFKDGSLTRLDSNSIFTLDKLVTTTGKRQIAGSIRVGQAWNRVEKLSQSEAFKQSANGATAGVLGTAFATSCLATAPAPVKTRSALAKVSNPESCRFTVIDGEVEVQARGGTVTLDAGQGVAIDANGRAADPRTFAPDELYSRPWIQQNLKADADAGLTFSSIAPTSGSVLGPWAVELLVTNATNVVQPAVGDVLNRTYTVTGTCSDPVTCTLTLTFTTRASSRTVPLTYINGEYTATEPNLSTSDCFNLTTGAVIAANAAQSRLNITFKPTAAALVGGIPTATAFSGQAVEQVAALPGFESVCQPGTINYATKGSR